MHFNLHGRDMATLSQEGSRLLLKIFILEPLNVADVIFISLLKCTILFIPSLTNWYNYSFQFSCSYLQIAAIYSHAQSKNLYKSIWTILSLIIIKKFYSVCVYVLTCLMVISREIYACTLLKISIRRVFYRIAFFSTAKINSVSDI